MSIRLARSRVPTFAAGSCDVQGDNIDAAAYSTVSPRKGRSYWRLRDLIVEASRLGASSAPERNRRPTCARRRPSSARERATTASTVNRTLPLARRADGGRARARRATLPSAGRHADAAPLARRLVAVADEPLGRGRAARGARPPPTRSPSTPSTYDAEGRPSEPWAPNRHKIADLLEALAAICHLPETCRRSRVDRRRDHDGRDRRLRQRAARRRRAASCSTTHPLFFNVTAVPFDYDPDAASSRRGGRVPRRAVGRRHRLDRRAAGVVRLHRSPGGSTCTRSCCSSARPAPARGRSPGCSARWSARENVAGPTLSSLAGDFGLAPLLGKPLAVISDARLNGRGAPRRRRAAARDLRRGHDHRQPQVPGAVDREAADAVHGDLERAAAAR